MLMEVTPGPQRYSGVLGFPHAPSEVMQGLFPCVLPLLTLSRTP